MPKSNTLRRQALAVILLFCVALVLGAVVTRSHAPRGPQAAEAQPSLQIVDGIRADPENWPGFAALRVQVGGGSRDYFCGGVAIAERWVLTAGHCDLGPWRRVEAVIDAGDLGAVREDQVYVVDKVVRHPGYGDPFSDGKDIALLHLARPYQGPVAEIAVDDRAEPEDGRARVAGHGRRSLEVAGVELLSEKGGAYAGSRALRAAEMTLVPTDACRAIYQSAFQRDFAIGEDQLCAIPAVGASGGASCLADSGGPLVAQGADGRLRVIGIVGWAFECGRADFPTVFTRVSRFAGWIASVTGGDGAD